MLTCKMIKKIICLKLLITLVFLFQGNVYASDNSFFSIKFTQLTPISDGFFTPQNLIDFKSSQFRELTYISPEDKKISFQASALISENNSLDNIRAFFSYKGIVISGSSGSIKGTFKQSGDSYFPGQNPPDRLFNTLLPQDVDFKGSSESFAIGKPLWKDIIFGFGYQKTIAPRFLSVETNQTRVRVTGRDRLLYDNSQDYYLQGVYPDEIIDAEGAVAVYGLWVRYDPISDAFKEAVKTNKPVVNYFFFYDAIIGNFEYTPGNKVSQDYAYATEQTAESKGFTGEGTTLKVYSSKSSLVNLVSNYGVGIQAVYPLSYTTVGVSAGYESTYSALDDYTVQFSTDFANKNDYAEAGLKETASKSSYGFFLRFAILY